MQMPPPTAMETLLESYLDKLHRFIWIFHEPTFMAEALGILSAASWRRQHLGKLLVILTVAALGLKCAIQDTSLEGRCRLDAISKAPKNLVEQLIGEVILTLR